MKSSSVRKKLGAILVAEEVLTQEQLNRALRLQRQSGGRLGSKLVELSYLEADQLTAYLSSQLGQPVVNLFRLRLEKQALLLMTVAQIKKYRVLPVAIDEQQRVVLAVVQPCGANDLVKLQAILGRPIKQIVVPAYQLTLAYRELRARINSLPEDGFMLLDPYPPGSARPALVGGEQGDIWSLLTVLRDSGASDLLLVAGTGPSLRMNNELVRIDGPRLTGEQVEMYAWDLMTRTQMESFKQTKDIDFAITDESLGRFRINIYYQRNTISIAIRHIIEDIPSLEELNLPAWLETYALKSQGLILVSGPNGHGKSTTLASMIDIINSKRKRNIITIEDPIEFLHRHKNSNVNQREVGIDTESFHSGLKRIYREAPDVILIGEMRDRESIAIALEAAETGHLVLSTLHSNNSTLAINRIIDVFPAEHQQQIRLQLADNLLLAFNQRLVKARDGNTRIPAFEKLTNSYRVANMIREGKAHQIRSRLVSSEEFHSLDNSLATLVKQNRILRDTAVHFAQDQKALANLLR